MPPVRRPVPALLTVLALIGLVWAVYAQVRAFGFIAIDDALYVTGNPHLVAQPGSSPDHGFAAARYALTTFAVSNWAPLVWASFFFDRWAFGLAPGPMHVENVVIHGVASLLLLGALADATGRLGRSAMVAAVFACHPMLVESVAWISERKDVLSIAWLFAAVWCYARFARTGRRRWYASTLGCYALSLSAKSTGVTLAGLLLLLDAWPLGRLRCRAELIGRIAEKVPLLAMAIAVAVVTVAAQRASGAVQTIAGDPLGNRVANAVLSYVTYAAKLAWPTRLACFYPMAKTFPAAAVAAAALLLAGVTAIALHLRRRRPYLLVGWLWFLGALVPMIGLVQVGDQAMADRYAYLPSVGFTLAIVWLVADVLPRRLAGTLGVAVVVALAVAAHRQVGYWRDNRSLFVHAVVVTDGNYLALHMLGHHELDQGHVSVAAALLKRAVAARPGFSDAVHDLGRCAHLAGDDRQAVILFGRAVALDPGNAQYQADLYRTMAAVRPPR